MTDSDSTPEPIRSLEARYYTDPEVFRLEQAGLLARTWQFAGHSSLVNKPGDYFTPVLHKIPVQNRFAASIAASKALYSFFLDLT